MGDIFAGLGFGLSVIALFYTWYQTSSKGPKIGIYGVELDGTDFINEKKHYWIRLKVNFENFGDKATDLTFQPEITVYDNNGDVLNTSKDIPRYNEFNFTKSVPILNTVSEDISFTLPETSKDWITGKIKFNAYYYKKRKLLRKWEKIIIKEDEFEFQRN